MRRLAAFDVVRYAQKANSNLAVLDLVRRSGALVDAVSAGEIHRALAAGYAARGRSARRSSTPPTCSTATRSTAVAEHGIPVNSARPT